ncbi:MAG TPA: PcfJ domain-containing protein [Verrucomicrobiae bacterium]|nr:PcfJ domain-containing protein [Verrucomicrobiae bacterium]
MVPWEDAMKFNPYSFPVKSKSKSRRKKEQAANKIDAAIKLALVELTDYRERRDAFLRLLACVRSRTPLLKPTPGQGNPGWVGPVFLINRLKNLAIRQHHWIRPCETWKPKSGNLRRTFRSLANHLLIEYSVPGFMDSVWDLPAGAEAFRQQSWHIRLGRGAAFRALNVPASLTRKMEHHARQAPDHYSVFQALRHGEIKGIGLHDSCARELVKGRLGQSMEHPEFWRTVLWFFMAHPETKPEHVNPIIEFIHFNKFAIEEVGTENGTELRTAPFPDFSLKGRRLKSLLRLVSAWQSDLLMDKPGESFSWARSAIQGFRFSEKRPGKEENFDWSIVELLNNTALLAEGCAMRHCVYSYASRCRCGETTIWSLRLRMNGHEKRMVTIEVDPRRRAIIQMRAKCNLRPGGRSREIIDKWASSAGLRFDL